MNLIKSGIKKAFVVILAVLMLFSVPVITNADSEGSIEIKMDLSYKYKRDDFRVIYKDASGREYDVTSKSELNIEPIETGVTTGGGDGIVRKAVATYDGLSDTVYEYTVFYAENSSFKEILGARIGGEYLGNMNHVNSYLVVNGDKRVMDILNIKIKNGIYYGEQHTAYYSIGKGVRNVEREVNYIGCNSNNSDYDMPVFDGEGIKNYFMTVRVSAVANNNYDRRTNLYNFQVQNYWNGIFFRSHNNSLMKGLVFTDIYTPEGAPGSNKEIGHSDYKSLAAFETVDADNNMIIDNEFNNNTGDGHMHLIYMANDSDDNYVSNNFFLNTNVNAIKLRNCNDNNVFTGNYFFDSGNELGKSGQTVGYITDCPQYINSKGEATGEELGRGTVFLGNHIRNSNPECIPKAVSIYPKDSTARRFDFDSNETSSCTISNYTHTSISDMDDIIRINRCVEGETRNEASISSDPYKPVRSVIRHVDKDGNALRANDVIVTNGGETFTAQAKADLIGADGNPIYTSDYKAKLYDESGKEVTKDADGNSIVDADGYIKTDGSGALLRSLKNDNQTFTFIYAPSARLTINHTGDTIDYSSITDIKELEKHIPVDVSSDTPAPAAAVETLMLKTESEDDVKGSSYLPLKFQSRKQKTNAVTLKWSKVSGAEQYVIYGNLCNTKAKKYKMVKIATLKGSKKSYTVKKIEGKKLKKGTYYKFVIVAQKGDKVIAAAKTIHVATSGSKNKSNYTGVNVDKKVIAKAKKLKKGASLSLKAKPSLKKGTKAQSHIKGKLRYESSNMMIATVSKNGKIRARGRGTCYIYVYTQSGIAKKIKLKIR